MIRDLQVQRLCFTWGVVLGTCALMSIWPGAAHAGYPFASAARVSLGFGATYRSTDGTSAASHRGVDLVAESGCEVLSPSSGLVTFVGRVPAVGGGSAMAVTVLTENGSLTMLPLADIRVAKGSTVAEGERIASLAQSGDGSSEETHVHVGLRRGDLYIDPLSLLSAPAIQVARDGSGAAGSPASAGAPRAAAAPNPTRGSLGASVSGMAATAPSTSSRSASSLRTATPGELISAGVRVVGGSSVPQTPSKVTGLGSASATGEKTGAWQPAVRDSAASAALAGLFERVTRSCANSARVGVAGGAVALIAVGLLWPLWRRQEEGSRQDHVSALGDDVAAVAGR